MRKGKGEKEKGRGVISSQKLRRVTTSREGTRDSRSLERSDRGKRSRPHSPYHSSTRKTNVNPKKKPEQTIGNKYCHGGPLLASKSGREQSVNLQRELPARRKNPNTL